MKYVLKCLIEDHYVSSYQLSPDPKLRFKTSNQTFFHFGLQKKDIKYMYIGKSLMEAHKALNKFETIYNCKYCHIVPLKE